MPNGDKNVTSNNEYANKEEKPIGMIPLEPVILGAKPKTKSTQSWSSEPDFIANYEAYQKAMNPLIADYKQSVTGAMDKAAGYVMEGALMAAPIPGMGIATRALGGLVKAPFRSLVNIPSVKPALKSVNPEFAVKHGVLPELKKTTSPLAYFDKTQKQNVETWVKILSEGAPTMKTARAKEISALSSGEGFKRLVDLESGFINTAWRAQRGNITGAGLKIEVPGGFWGRKSKTIKPSDFGAAAVSNARLRLQELSVPSVNESLSTLLNTQGKLNFKNFMKAQDLIMSTPTGGGAVGANLRSFQHNAFAHAGNYPYFSKGKNIISQRFSYDEGKVALGTGNLKSLPTAEHELGHILQKGYATKFDKSLQMIKPKKGIHSSPQWGDYRYFTHGGARRNPRITEAMPFAKEFRNVLHGKGIIKSRYQPITTNLLRGLSDKTFKAKDYPGGHASTRIYDFASKSRSNLSLLASEMNKVPAFAPFITLGALSGGNKNKNN